MIYKMRSKSTGINVIWTYSLPHCREQKFLEMDVLVEGLSLEIPIYVITEGHEPPFFTRFFSWDHSKANVSLLPSKL